MTVPGDIEARIVDREVYSHLQNELKWLVAYLREVRDFLGDDTEV